MCNIQCCVLLCTSCKLYYFGCFNTVHYSAHYATRFKKIMFLQRLARRLSSEHVVSMMDKLYDNNVPSDSNDDRLDNGDGEIENDELSQLSTISCTFSRSAWCAQLCTKLNFLGFLLQSMVFIGTGYLIWDCIHPMVDHSGIYYIISKQDNSRRHSHRHL